MDWVKVGKLSYYIPSLTLEDKIRLGLDKLVLDALDEIQPSIKNKPCKKCKKVEPEIKEEIKPEIKEDE